MDAEATSGGGGGGGGDGGGLGDGGGGFSVKYATSVLRSLASTSLPAKTRRAVGNMAAGLELNMLEKTAGVRVAVGGK